MTPPHDQQVSQMLPLPVCIVVIATHNCSAPTISSQITMNDVETLPDTAQQLAVI